MTKMRIPRISRIWGFMAGDVRTTKIWYFQDHPKKTYFQDRPKKGLFGYLKKGRFFGPENGDFSDLGNNLFLTPKTLIISFFY